MLLLKTLALAGVTIGQFGRGYGPRKDGFLPQFRSILGPATFPSIKKTRMCVRRLRTFVCKRKISLKFGQIFKKHPPAIPHTPIVNKQLPTQAKPTQTNPLPTQAKPLPTQDKVSKPHVPIYNDKPHGPIYDAGSEITERDQANCQLGTYKTHYKFEVLMNSKADRDVIPVGQCTEWVDGRYFEYTGQHITFHGRAFEWVDQARQSLEWEVSTTPKVPSIVVMQAGAQGASKDTGHVGIAESSSGSKVCTSNWNSPTPGVKSFKVIKTGPGIHFLTLKPGAKIQPILQPHSSSY